MNIPRACCHPNLQALQDTIHAVGGKWKIPILKSICIGNMYFNDIERSLPGLTKRSLSMELKELEANGFIRRTIEIGSTKKAFYIFTPYAKSLVSLIDEMVRWGEEHSRRVKGQRRMQVLP